MIQSCCFLDGMLQHQVCATNAGTKLHTSLLWETDTCLKALPECIAFGPWCRPTAPVTRIITCHTQDWTAPRPQPQSLWVLGPASVPRSLHQVFHQHLLYGHHQQHHHSLNHHLPSL